MSASRLQMIKSDYSFKKSELRNTKEKRKLCFVAEEKCQLSRSFTPWKKLQNTTRKMIAGSSLMGRFMTLVRILMSTLEEILFFLQPLVRMQQMNLKMQDTAKPLENSWRSILLESSTKLLLCLKNLSLKSARSSQSKQKSMFRRLWTLQTSSGLFQSPSLASL